MARAVRFRKESQTDFYKAFTGLCQSKSSWEVWADFVAMAAITISNAFDQEGQTHDDREQQYIRTIKRYSKADQQVFPKLFMQMVDAMEAEPDQDFLGEMFMGLELGNHWKGQFFTPYNVCRMMAEMQIDGIETRIERQGWVGVNDPCCGAGALLIAARNAMVRREIGPSAALYVAQDVDRTAALMCYLQLSLLGCAGYVVVADSLRYPVVGPGKMPLLISPVPEQEIWLMPALYMEPWPARIQWEWMRLALESLGVMKTASAPPMTAKQPKAEPPVIVQSLNETTSGQLTFF